MKLTFCVCIFVVYVYIRGGVWVVHMCACSSGARDWQPFSSSVALNSQSFFFWTGSFTEPKAYQFGSVDWIMGSKNESVPLQVTSNGIADTRFHSWHLRGNLNADLHVTTVCTLLTEPPNLSCNFEKLSHWQAIVLIFYDYIIWK